jgi:hypothetical protein
VALANRRSLIVKIPPLWRIRIGRVAGRAGVLPREEWA